MKTSIAYSAVLASLLGGTALAQPSETPPIQQDDPRDGSSLSAIAGVLTPTGNIGVEYAHAVNRRLEIGLGAGLGSVVAAALLADNQGPKVSVAPQFSVMPRLRKRSGSLLLTGGVGVSLDTGLQDKSISGGETWADTRVALWANVEFGAQLVSKTGWSGGAFVGLGSVVATGEAHNKMGSDADHMPDDMTGLTLPYVGLRFGHTL